MTDLKIRRAGAIAARFGALAGVLVSAAPPAAAHQTARGVVFEDLNGNALRDDGEPGIAGVAVSNQHDVIVTDDAGGYALPVDDDTILFVSQPSGYAVPLNEKRLPQFYYLHKPNGSPALHFRGVAPTGALPPSVDFPLTRCDEPETFSVVAFADPQPETTQEVQYIRDDVLSELAGVEAAFGITLGDIVSNHLNLYETYNDAVAQVGIPFYNVIGNHDLNFDAADDRDSDETFHRHFGPNYYSWNYAKVHFVALDDVEWMGPHQGGGNYRGAFGARQLEWLAKDLAVVPADRLVVLTMHIPMLIPETYECRDVGEVFNVLKNRARVLALSGHTHYQEHVFFDADDGWHGDGSFHHLNAATVSGAWWSGPKDIRGIPTAECRDGAPNGYSIITFTGSDYVTSYKAAGFDRDYQMRIYPPGSTGFSEHAERTLWVNVFDGSVRCTVDYSIDHGTFRRMQPAPRRDPLAVAILTGVLDSGKSWARPNLSRHMWTAELPEPPWRGAHVVTIRVTDHFGRVREQSKIFVP